MRSSFHFFHFSPFLPFSLPFILEESEVGSEWRQEMGEKVGKVCRKGGGGDGNFGSKEAEKKKGNFFSFFFSKKGSKQRIFLHN